MYQVVRAKSLRKKYVLFTTRRNKNNKNNKNKENKKQQKELEEGRLVEERCSGTS